MQNVDANTADPVKSRGSISPPAQPRVGIRHGLRAGFNPTCVAAVVAAALLAPLAARAGLWGYVDGSGMAHVASVQVDSRYRLVLGDGVSSEARVPGKTDDASGLVTWIEIAPEVRVLLPLMRDAAREHGIDLELLEAVIAVESGFRENVVSPRGAVGLMQITPQTADRYASKSELLRPAVERLLDARNNLRTGARMLADLTRRFGRIDLALAAWNAGEGTVRRAGGRMPAIDETRAHVQLVLELYWALLQNSQSRNATRLLVHAD